MFDLGRELMRFFSPAEPREGLALGDPALLELLDLRLLRSEAKAADVAAGRIGARDRVQRLIEASGVWRELGRRTGDPAALRKSAAHAEEAAGLARRHGRSPALGQALSAQAEAALVACDLFGDESLLAAAGFLADQASGVTTGRVLAARLAMRRAVGSGELAAVIAAAEGLERQISHLGSRRRADLYSAACLRCERAEALVAAGARLGEPSLVRRALQDLDRIADALDVAYQPLTFARAQEVRGAALVRLAGLTGDAAQLVEAAKAIQEGIEAVMPDHAPLDWARLQHSYGLALCALGEAADSEAAFAKALQAFSKASAALSEGSHLVLRTLAAQDRGACIVRRAEARGDGFALDEAEAILRSELAGLGSSPDPMAWGVLQLSLARVYLARARLGGPGRGERARAGEALAVAFDVFTEGGQRTLALAAQEALGALCEASAAH